MVDPAKVDLAVREKAPDGSAAMVGDRILVSVVHNRSWRRW